MPIRIYLAPQIGSGTSTQDPIRSILNDFVDVRNGDKFDEIDNPSVKQSICTVYASQETHDAIYADRVTNPGRIVYISNLINNALDHDIGLQTEWRTLPQAFKNAAISKLNDVGVTANDLSDTVTLKDVLRVVLHTFFNRQREFVGGIVPLKWDKIKFSGVEF